MEYRSDVGWLGPATQRRLSKPLLPMPNLKAGTGAREPGIAGDVCYARNLAVTAVRFLSIRRPAITKITRELSCGRSSAVSTFARISEMSTLFEFVLVATGLDPNDDAFEDRLVNAGCDDATISFQRGLILLDFARHVDDMELALVSALANVRDAGAYVRGIEPSDLVSLAEIARRANMTRAAISNYFAGLRSADFPLPRARVTTDSPLWSWAEVAEWLYERERVDLATVEAAKLIAAVTAKLAPGPDEVCEQRLASAEARIGIAA
jgi:hypothetical protein